MANRNQDNNYGLRRSSGSWSDYGRSDSSQWNNPQDDDEGRYSSRAERDTEDRGIYGNESYSGYGNFGSEEQSGSSGGYGYGDQSGYGESTTQSRYGQRFQRRPNYERVSQGEDYGSSGTSQYGRSNFGSGRTDAGWQGMGRQTGWSEPYGEGQQYGSSGSAARSQGQHRGKGPKGYQRSDERIKELVSESLSDHPEIDASEITVNMQGGKLTLEGSVDSRWTKNAVEDIAEQFCQDVQNNLKVSRQGQGQAASGSKSTGSTAKSGAGTDESDGASKQKRN